MPGDWLFRDRRDAGRRLGALVARAGIPDPVVLGMARGGIVVAAEVASVLDAPLDVLVVRKLGCPGQPELALGAIGEGGVEVRNEHLIAELDVPESVLASVARGEATELERHLAAYRGGRPALAVTGRHAVVVDDGLATGASARAAVRVVRARDAASVTLAVPVAPPAAVEALRSDADDVLCVEQGEGFIGLSQWYADFHQVSDDEVRRLLAGAP